MNAAELQVLEHRILVLAPTARDADLAEVLFTRSSVQSQRCRDLAELIRELGEGAAAILVPEEALVASEGGQLAEWLRQQPPWSDLPVLVLARSGVDSTTIARAMEQLGNIVVIDRPTRAASLVSAARTALRARQRQYQLRDQLAERERNLAAQAFLGAIVESSDDAIISKTLDGTILTWNAGAERLFGYTAEEVIGHPILILIPPERHAEERDLLDRLRRAERIEHFETVRVAKDGRRIHVSLSVSPVRDSSGAIIGASKVARDITQRKEVEAALVAADRKKDEFLAILAHELRNPLAPIQNSVSILRLSSAREPGRNRVLEIMERQVNVMVRLVDDLLEISRITRGKIELRLESVDLADVLTSAVDTCRSLLEAGRHAFQIELPAGPLRFVGDPVRLEQVFSNLLNNAAKYTEPGGQITLKACRDQGSFAVAVSDSGRGIAPELLPRVFDLFMQVERSPDRARGGLGIGLTLVRTLVEMHGGTVVAQSAGLGQGSTFVVRLPVGACVAGAVAPPSPDRLQRSVPRRVLVVDDNVDAAESLAVLLRMLGAEVRVAGSGPEGLTQMSTFHPEAVLLDIGMPAMDGHEVARRIRARAEYAGVTLIAVTGWGQPEDRRRSRQVGFDFHLVKPVDLPELTALLNTLEAGRVATQSAPGD